MCLWRYFHLNVDCIFNVFHFRTLSLTFASPGFHNASSVFETVNLKGKMVRSLWVQLEMKIRPCRYEISLVNRGPSVVACQDLKVFWKWSTICWCIWLHRLKDLRYANGCAAEVCSQLHVPAKFSAFFFLFLKALYCASESNRITILNMHTLILAHTLSLTHTPT